jgi:hypothetical protein
MGGNINAKKSLQRMQTENILPLGVISQRAQNNKTD